MGVRFPAHARQAKTDSALVRTSPSLSMVPVKHDADPGGSTLQRVDPDEQLDITDLTGSGHAKE